jgi:two-component system sensor histidine kinase/response regulator
LGETREGRQKRAERQADAAPRIPEKVLAGTRILLAEDNPVNREVAIEMLRGIGCDVDAVEQGQEAVEAVQARRYDLVLLDCQMPQMDGFAASQAIRAGERGSSLHVPIVALTASAMKGDRERCLESGMDDYLSKPFTQATLQDIVCRWAAAGDRPIRTATVNPDSGAVPGVKDVQGTVMRMGPKAGVRSNEAGGVLDRAAIQALRSFNHPSGPDVFRRLITVYLKSSMVTMAVLRDAVAQSNAAAIFQAAHGLKSSSAMFGGRRFADLLKQLEAAGQSGMLEPVEALLASAEMEYDLFSRALQDYLNESAA